MARKSKKERILSEIRRLNREIDRWAAKAGKRGRKSRKKTRR